MNEMDKVLNYYFNFNRKLRGKKLVKSLYMCLKGAEGTKTEGGVVIPWRSWTCREFNHV